MIKLLQFNTTLNYGSTGRIAENIGVLANQSGFDTYIVHGPRFINQSKLKTICSETSLEEKIHGIKSLLIDSHGLGSVKATYNLVPKIKEINPDIFHLHNIHGYYINYPILFSFLKEYNKPIVWTFHDCWNFTGHCAHFAALNCNKWQFECNKCPGIANYPKSFLDFSQRNYNLKKNSFTGLKNLTIIPVSNWLSNLIEKSFFKNYNKRLIYNGIDLDIFSPQKNSVLRNQLNLKNKFVILGVAAPWSKKKGFNDIIKLSKIIDSKSTIIIIGVSKEQKRELPNNIIGIERTDNINQLAEYYSMADLFFNPTWEDNFPTTNLEALACGTPVATYNTGGSPEAIDCNTGFVIEQGDISSVLPIIEKVKSANKEYYIEACRKRATLLYNKNDRYKDYINLYNELLNKK